MDKELLKLKDELVEATKIRDSLEVDYEYEKAQLVFSNVVAGLKNQTERDAQITLLMHESGWDRKIAEARTNARVAYYKWSSIKSLIDGNRYEKDN